MRGVAQAGHGGLVARRLALLAVLLGLLAMHGVALGHHAAAGPPTATIVAGTQPASGDHHGAGSQAHPPSVDVAVLAVPAPSCDETCESSLTTLCLAVITIVALAALVTRRRGSLVTRASARRRGAPIPRGPDPARLDPVAELCVSRT